MFSSIYSCFLRCFILNLVTIFTASRFWPLYKGFTQNHGNSLFEPSTDSLFHKLQSLVQHAFDNTEYYQNRYSQEGVSNNLLSFNAFKEYPHLTKQDIENNFPDQITSRLKQGLPWRYVSTSGTIERLTVINDFIKRDYIRASELLGLHFSTGYLPGMKILEIPPDICTDVCGAVDVVEPGIVEFLVDHIKTKDLTEPEIRSDLTGMIERQLIQRKTILPSFPSGGTNQDDKVLQAYIDDIACHQPYVIKALPAYLFLLARFVIHKRLQLRKPPRGVMPMGGGITSLMQSEIEAGFSCPVLQDYGCAEMGTIASECPGKKGLQTYQALFYLEVVNQNRQVNPGEIGKLIITDLHNSAMPMIRYDIGDIARLIEVDETSGNVKSFEILGRVSDSIRLTSNHVLSPNDITDFILKDNNILFFQLELTRTGICRLDVAAIPGSEKLDLPSLSARLDNLMESNFTIKARKVKSIQPERSGKYRFVKNLSKEHQVVF